MLLLVLIVLVPTACVLWLLSEATRNERLAVRQRLAEAYRAHLDAVQGQFRKSWESRRQSIAALIDERPAAGAFAAIAETGLADSVVVFDSAGDVLYPSQAVPLPVESVDDWRWRAAEQLEFVDQDPLGAAAAYRELAENTSDISANLSARALQATARCLLRAGQEESAVEILNRELQSAIYREAVDLHGRWIAADADLRVLQVVDRQSSWSATAENRLVARLNDYQHPLPHPGQRLFLMREVRSLLGSQVQLPTMEAEELAAQQLASQPQSDGAATAGPGIWPMPVANGRALALIREQTLLEDLRQLIETQPLPDHTAMVPILPGGQPPSIDREFLSVALSSHLPGWRLALAQTQPAAADLSARQRVSYYIWATVLMVLTTTALAAMVGSAFRRQVRLTQLKNDLVATVSHELKTPVSSIRLLVDTLLEQRVSDPVQTQEYLALISKENTRLSRVIDNFLTFSRLERGKHRYHRAAVDPATIVERAVSAVRERSTAERCCISVEIAPALPRLWADADALVTVLINLLDNAIKYTGDDKQIRVRAAAAEGEVHLAVQDNGIGIDTRSARRVFDQFYQADRTLARAAEGCGLGLSIARSLVRAHGGRLTVDSRPGRGSTFTVALPLADTHLQEAQR